MNATHLNDDRIEITPEMKRRANILARTYGTTKATKIILGKEDRVIEFTSCGYRKNTTGEYVSKAYRNNFGWKNTYYQPVICEVMLAM